MAVQTGQNANGLCGENQKNEKTNNFSYGI